MTCRSACFNDPVKSTSTEPGRGDHRYLVVVSHAAFDGESDTHTVDDLGPRSVTPPFPPEPYPDGTIQDKGCGKPKAGWPAGSA